MIDPKRRYMLTQHPEVEARIVEELDAMELLTTYERPNPRKLVYDDLKQLNYLQCVIKVGSALPETARRSS